MDRHGAARHARAVVLRLLLPAPPCPSCGAGVQRDDGVIVLNGSRYHSDCAQAIVELIALR